jgi:hypothetical protein
MTQTHDIFLRALAVPTDVKRGHTNRRKIHASLDSKWPEYALVFDTETRITADQSLTFGVYRYCNLMDGIYCVIEEGVFYADDLPAKDLKVLNAYINSCVSDVATFPP